MTTDPQLERALERFRKAGREMRMQLLLSYAKRFPELPAELAAARDAGLNRIRECQTPLFLWVGVEEGVVHLHADAPREAPTVRGFMSFLIEVLDGKSPEMVASLPDTLLEDMGLGEVLGVMRTQGLGAVIRRVKGDVARAAAG
jgi:cysteine desulfuration protein SufE